MIKLHQFKPFWGMPNASPFCMKAETYLRYAGIEYEPVASDPRKSPTGQIPFIVTESGETISDSEKIIEHYEAQSKQPMNQGMSDAELAQAWLIRTRIEETLYWQITYMRWGDPEGWKVFLPDLKPSLGRKKYFLPYMIRFMLLRQMKKRSMTPQDTDKSYASGMVLLDKLSNVLDKKPYFFGDQIRTVDMSLYAFIANIIDQPHSNQLQDHARSLDNLVDYCERIKQLVWKNWKAE